MLIKGIEISDKFTDKMLEYDMYSSMLDQDIKAYKGSIDQLEGETGLYYLIDEKGNDICGILDTESFYVALSGSEPFENLFSIRKMVN